jgi:uncharacterized OsmC-like protein
MLKRMDADQLRKLQAPLKSRYKEEPGAALRTLRAAGRVSQETLTCALLTGKAGTPAGLHDAAGGDGTAACSGDMLLEAIVGCAGVTLASVATAMGMNVSGAIVSAEGDLDFRGTLGVARDVPVGFSQIRLVFEIGADAPTEQLEKLVQLTERYCVVLQTLTRPPSIAVRTKGSS